MIILPYLLFIQFLIFIAIDVRKAILMTALLIGMRLVDAMGLVPCAYPGYQIFVWGFIGLVLRGVEGLTVPGRQATRAGADVWGISMPGHGLPC